jgi:hypothetical protein
VVLHDQAPSIEDFCNKLHKQLVSQLKYAWVWGSSVRHQPQKVSSHAEFRVLFWTCVSCPLCQLWKTCHSLFFVFFSVYVWSSSVREGAHSV